MDCVGAHIDGIRQRYVAMYLMMNDTLGDAGGHILSSNDTNGKHEGKDVHTALVFEHDCLGIMTTVPANSNPFLLIFQTIKCLTRTTSPFRPRVLSITHGLLHRSVEGSGTWKETRKCILD